MERDKKIEMINQFFDGEMTKEAEAYLFTELSSDEELRDYFKNLNSIKTAIGASAEEFPDQLDEQILMSLPPAGEKRFRLFERSGKINYFVYAFSIVLLFLSIFFFYNTSRYRSDLENAMYRIEEQQRMLLLLTNSLPTAEINPAYENEIIIDAKL